jgi:DNA (cytosine-5)-methyltransferase 1
MNMIDLFAGIGGFSLAGHRAGFETVAFVEWDKYLQKVLAKNFPNVPIFCDIKEFDGKKYKGTVDLICGGFPCQPFSTAGKREGTNDDRYLWPQMLRVIREVQPFAVLGENVTGILSMDNGSVFEEICSSLEGEGYSVQAFNIPACGKGAPHRRERVWIVAYSSHILHQRKMDSGRTGGKEERSKRSQLEKGKLVRQRLRVRSTECDKIVGNADEQRLQRSNGIQKAKGFINGYRGRAWERDWHEVANTLCRVDDVVPARLDRHRRRRMKALGNAIVPQIAYEFLVAIKSMMHED